jgi:PAS domain S-box-containing protein
MFKNTIRTKLLFTVLVLLLLTIGATDLLWYQLAQPILTDKISKTQVQLAARASDVINQYIATKERVLIVHSQSAAFLTQNLSLERVELYTLLNQDPDIVKITMIDTKGKEILSLRPTEEVPIGQLTDQSSSPAFIVPTFQYGIEYISPVFYDNNVPTITLSVPITFPSNTQQLSDLTTVKAGGRRAGEIIGVLEVNIKLANILHDTTSLGNKDTGEIFIVDNTGKVIVHQNSDIASQTDFSTVKPVQAFISSKNQTSGITTSDTPPVMQYKDQNNQSVMGTFSPITKTDWAVVVQQPVKLATIELNSISQFALLLLILGLVIAVPIAYAFSKRLSDPIQELAKGAEIIGDGNFDYKISVSSHDEIGTLSTAFQTMAKRLQNSIQSMEKERNIATAERNKLSMIIAGIQDAVIAVDTHRNITLINKAAEEMLKINSHQVIGQPINVIVKLYSGQNQIDVETYCPIRHEHSEGILFDQKRIKLIAFNHTELYVNFLSGSIPEGNTINLGCILTIHDITKEAQLEEMKFDFVSMAAHELRTPLTAVIGYLSVYLHNYGEKLDHDQLSNLTRIDISAKKLRSLIETLLSVSKIEGQKLTSLMQPTDWVNTLQKTLEEFQPRAREENIDLSFTPPTTHIEKIYADPLRTWGGLIKFGVKCFQLYSKRWKYYCLS